jgi:hypothetical protein
VAASRLAVSRLDAAFGVAPMETAVPLRNVAIAFAETLRQEVMKLPESRKQWVPNGMELASS